MIQIDHPTFQRKRWDGYLPPHYCYVGVAREGIGLGLVVARDITKPCAKASEEHRGCNDCFAIVERVVGRHLVQPARDKVASSRSLHNHSHTNGLHAFYSVAPRGDRPDNAVLIFSKHDIHFGQSIFDEAKKNEYNDWFKAVSSDWNDALPEGYRFVANIASGSYGQVVKARDTTICPQENHEKGCERCLVAVKRFGKLFNREDNRYAELALKEIVINRHIRNNPNDHVIHAFGAVWPRGRHRDNFLDGKPNAVFLFMKYVPNSTTLLKKINFLRTRHDQVKKIAHQIALGLYHLHSDGIFHRDLKPQNILVATATAADTADITSASIFDFGLADYKASTSVVGSTAYFAPEILRRDKWSLPSYLLTGQPVSEFSFPADVWSLGLVLAQIMGVNLKSFSTKTFGEDLGNLVQLIHDSLKNGCNFGASNLPSIIITRNVEHDRKIQQWRSELSSLVFYHGKEGLDLLGQMLDINPETRITMEGVMKHSFFAKLKQTLDVQELKEIRQNSDVLKELPASSGPKPSLACITSFDRMSESQLRNAFSKEFSKFEYQTKLNEATMFMKQLLCGWSFKKDPVEVKVGGRFDHYKWRLSPASSKNPYCLLENTKPGDYAYYRVTDLNDIQQRQTLPKPSRFWSLNRSLGKKPDPTKGDKINKVRITRRHTKLEAWSTKVSTELRKEISYYIRTVVDNEASAENEIPFSLTDAKQAFHQLYERVDPLVNNNY